MRANRLTQFVSDDHSWSLGARSSRKDHDPSTRRRESRLPDILSTLTPDSLNHRTHLQKAHGNPNGIARAPQRPLVVPHRPRVAAELLQDCRELELDLRDRKKESSGAKVLRNRLAWTRRDTILRGETKHILYVLLRVVLRTTEDVRFGAFGVAKFVDLNLNQSRVNILQISMRDGSMHTIVPYVISPTKAY